MDVVKELVDYVESQEQASKEQNEELSAKVEEINAQNNLLHQNVQEKEAEIESVTKILKEAEAREDELKAENVALKESQKQSQAKVNNLEGQLRQM